MLHFHLVKNILKFLLKFLLCPMCSLEVYYLIFQFSSYFSVIDL